jgi:hypothetical protein
MRRIPYIAFALLAGCPVSQEVPDRPPGAACSVDADCVPAGEPACGLVAACVDQRCEAEPTVLVPCP